MAVELLGGDSKCEAWPLDHIDDEDDQSSPSPKFLFFLHAVLSRPVAVDDQEEEEEEEEEDRLGVLPDNMVDSVNVGKGHVALDYNVVMDEVRSKVAIKDMLCEIGIVPVQDFMVQRILDTALSMSKDKRFVGRKVFRMGVHIDAIVDDLPPHDDDDEDMEESDDEYEDEDMVGLEGEDDWEPKFEPANRVSIEELERVNVEIVRKKKLDVVLFALMNSKLGVKLLVCLARISFMAIVLASGSKLANSVPCVDFRCHFD